MGIIGFAIETVVPDKISGDDLEIQIQKATAEILKLREERKREIRETAISSNLPVLMLIDRLFEHELIDKQTREYAQEIAGFLLINQASIEQGKAQQSN